ncbi:GID complex subunit 8 homolog protein Houki [Oratosquilla oratoria]|uniref:GID complex subunit 8 homolog protein Houki n=1 Tax=Oratosquilla oratoria TaxID=337810 RepID=UPI003F75E3B9
MSSSRQRDGAQSALDASEWIEEINKMHIHRADMNKLIMNYLVTEGFKEAAEKFAVEANIKPPMDLDQLDEHIRIRSAIQCGCIQEAIRMVTALHPEILDDNSQLYFHLQQQMLIELIREGRVEEAVVYAQDHLAERGTRDPAVLRELERTLALLAFEQPHTSPFGDLLHPSHRQKVASELNAAILKAQNQEETTPRIAKLLKLLLWGQEELNKKKVPYPVMTDLIKGTIEEQK